MLSLQAACKMNRYDVIPNCAAKLREICREICIFKYTFFKHTYLIHTVFVTECRLLFYYRQLIFFCKSLYFPHVCFNICNNISS